MNAAQKLPEPILFEDLSEDVLREMAKKTGYSRIGWDAWTKDQLIAFFRNRGDRFVENERG